MASMPEGRARWPGRPGVNEGWLCTNSELRLEMWGAISVESWGARLMWATG
jgi:hypothetical protein